MRGIMRGRTRLNAAAAKMDSSTRNTCPLYGRKSRVIRLMVWKRVLRLCFSLLLAAKDFIWNGAIVGSSFHHCSSNGSVNSSKPYGYRELGVGRSFSVHISPIET